jgi:hypothetical protein
VDLRARSLPAGASPIVKVPALGSIAPDSTFSVVDLPQPLGPSRASMVPAATSKLTSCTIACLP